MGWNVNYFNFIQGEGGLLQKALKTLLNGEEKEAKENVSNTDHNLSSLQMSFLEVYNEAVYDLLSDGKLVDTKPDGFGGEY